MSIKHHYLKTLPKYYIAQEKGIKTFEVRKKDRDFRVGDILHLQEFVPPDTYTSREIMREVTYILDDAEYCKDGYVILGTQNPAISVNPITTLAQGKCNNTDGYGYIV